MDISRVCLVLERRPVPHLRRSSEGSIVGPRKTGAIANVQLATRQKTTLPWRQRFGPVSTRSCHTRINLVGAKQVPQNSLQHTAGLRTTAKNPVVHMRHLVGNARPPELLFNHAAPSRSHSITLNTAHGKELLQCSAYAFHVSLHHDGGSSS